MEKTLADYIEQVQHVGIAVDEDVGHGIASMLVAFSNGLYRKTVERGEKVLESLEGITSEEKTIQKALGILINHAQELVSTGVGIQSGLAFEGRGRTAGFVSATQEGLELSFDDRDREFLAVELPEEQIEVKKIYDRDNALFLLYVVGISASPPDALSLQEHLEHVLQTKWDSYKRKLESSED